MQVYIHVLILRKQFGHMICRFYLNNPTQEINEIDLSGGQGFVQSAIVSKLYRSSCIRTSALGNP